MVNDVLLEKRFIQVYQILHEDVSVAVLVLYGSLLFYK